MLTELHLEHLGVIDRLDLVLHPGLTALTGETGAGKTMLVGAVELVVGGRADATIVRTGERDARVDARFTRPSGDDPEGTDVVLSRVVPNGGRSRAYLDGRPATVGALVDLARSLVDLHGQHAHQGLLHTSTQRAALDRFAGIDVGPLLAARTRLADAEAALADAGGDERARAREIDLLRFQIGELDDAALEDPDEERRLESDEEALADVVGHRLAGNEALERLRTDGAGRDQLALAGQSIEGRRPFDDAAGRLDAILADLDDIIAELRDRIDALEDDPARLEQVRARRQQVRDLCRKYGDEVADVMAYREQARLRLAELDGHDEQIAMLEQARDLAASELTEIATTVGGHRRRAAGTLARSVTERLRQLAMPHAVVEIRVGPAEVDLAGERVEFLLAANPGSEPAPLAKVASGGELARAMLALRLALLGAGGESVDDDPPTLVFDEVDAGLGGAAALAVAEALADLGRRYQVLVVTHLAQVAAVADQHLVVHKSVRDGVTTAVAEPVDGPRRVDELARMLSGAITDTARDHARELLERAARR